MNTSLGAIAALHAVYRHAAIQHGRRDGVQNLMPTPMYTPEVLTSYRKSCLS